MRNWRPVHVLEFVLLAGGLICLVWFGQDWMQAKWSQHQAERELAEAMRSRSRTAPDAEMQTPQRRPARGETIGRVEIPRLKISAIVKSGVDDKTLKRAVGHVPYTPLPGEKGNVGIAAHRDTFFRNLKGVRKGDLIRVVTPEAAYEYTVDDTKIVFPKNVEVLDPTPANYLTLVTCYPFNYVGSAPQRFIVHARQIGEAEPQARTRDAAAPRVAANGGAIPGRMKVYAP